MWSEEGSEVLQADYDIELQYRNRLVDVAIEIFAVFSKIIAVFGRVIEREHADLLVLDVFFDDVLQHI